MLGSEQVISVSYQLHWFPVRFSVKFRVLISPSFGALNSLEDHICACKAAGSLGWLVEALQPTLIGT